MTDQNKIKDIWARLVAKAWIDPKFKKKLLTNSDDVFQEENIKIPENIKVHIFENTEKDLNFVIPMKPKGDLSEEQLKRYSAGDCGSCK